MTYVIKLSKIQLKLFDLANKGCWVHPRNMQEKAMNKLVKLKMFEINTNSSDGFKYMQGGYILTDFGSSVLGQLAKLSWDESWDGQTIIIG